MSKQTDLINIPDAITVSGSNVGIGTSTPLSKLNVKGTQGNWRIDPDSVSGEMQVLSTTTANDGFINFRLRSNESIFETSGTERMRIDSSGKLLVGKTSAGYNVDGFEAHPNGETYVSRSGTPMAINRNSSDGTLLNFYKDGTTVGSIGVIDGNNTFLQGPAAHAGIAFANLNVVPFREGTYRNNEIDLGHPSFGFKDAYIGGGIYLGGTGSANKLDDVETGTWTPQYDANTITWNYQSQFGAYVKVGKLVHIQFYLNASIASGTSGFATKIINLPFTSANLSSLHQSGMSVWFSGSIDPQPLVDNAQTKISLWKKGAVALATAADVSSHYLVGSGTYYAS